MNGYELFMGLVLGLMLYPWWLRLITQLEAQLLAWHSPAPKPLMLGYLPPNFDPRNL